jgi:hypothetical protein
LKKIGLRVLNLLEHDMLRHFLFILEVIFYSVGLEAVIITGAFLCRVAGVQRLSSELRLNAVC